MLPHYVLVTYGERKILGFAEWSDLVPATSGTVMLKPLYVGPARGEIHNRTIAGIAFRDMKRQRAGGENTYVSESELVASTREAGVFPDVDEITSLVVVPRLQVEKEWCAAPWERLRHRVPPQTASAIEIVLTELFDEAEIGRSERSLWAIGSLLYDETFDVRHDIDLAMYLAPASCARFRKAIARRRVAEPRLVPEGDGFAFAYRLRVGAADVDVFPAMPSDCVHPIARATSWRISGSPRTRSIRVQDVAWSSYALPLLRVSGTPNWVLICSNAFRGAFWEGQELTVVVRAISIEFQNGTFAVDAVLDPARDIVGWNEFLSYQSDRNWVT